MTIADVAALLDGLGMKKYAPKFEEFAIDGLTVRGAHAPCAASPVAGRVAGLTLSFALAPADRVRGRGSDRVRGRLQAGEQLS